MNNKLYKLLKALYRIGALTLTGFFLFKEQQNYAVITLLLLMWLEIRAVHMAITPKNKGDGGKSKADKLLEEARVEDDDRSTDSE